LSRLNFIFQGGSAISTTTKAELKSGQDSAGEESGGNIFKCQAKRCKHNIENCCRLPGIVIGSDGKCDFYKIDRFLGDTSSDVY